MFFKDKSILLSDFDYTLYEHDNPDIFANNLSAIREWRSHGNLFAITTGRSKESLKAIFPDYDKYTDFCILCDGALVLDRHDKVVYRDHFGPDLAKQLNAALAQFNHASNYAIICYNGTDEAQTIGPCTGKVRFWFSATDDCAALEKILTEQFGNSLSYITYPKVAFNDDVRLEWIDDSLVAMIEVNRKGIDKKTGIDRLLSATNLNRSANIIAIGDGPNDVHMIDAFNGYAVEKASPTILAKIPHTRVVPHLHNLITSKLSLV